MNDPSPAEILAAENAYWEGLRDTEPEGGAELCWTCHGEQWVIVGLEIDGDDGVNGPYDGETIRCPNCHGSGLARDCWYW